MAEVREYQPKHALVERPRDPIPRPSVAGRHRMQQPGLYPDTPPFPVTTIMTAMAGMIALTGPDAVEGSFQPPKQEKTVPYVGNVPAMAMDTENAIPDALHTRPVTGSDIAKLHSR